MKKFSALLILISSLLLFGCGGLLSDIKSLQAPLMLQALPPIYSHSGPSAKANIKYHRVNVGDVLEFDASTSIDATDYLWRVVKHPAGSASAFQTHREVRSRFVVDQPGNYQLQLQVSDLDGRTDSFDIQLSTDEDELPRSRFVVIGDFGYGTDKQYTVGRAMAGLCAEQGCDFVLSVGDNIYNTGIDSVRDELIERNFEKPFSVLELPFYMVLGNHDTGGVGGDGGLNIRGDIQVEYARWKEKKSYRWQMPARYYRIPAPVEQPEKQPLVDIFAIDTSLITSPYDVIQRYNLSPMYERMSRWLVNEKRQSKAQWQLAFGHHTYLSNGKHGNAGNYRNLKINVDNNFSDRVRGVFVKRFLEEHVCGDMPLWLSGHEHNLQDLKTVSDCAGTEFVVSGAGASANAFENPHRNASHWQAESQLGVFHVDIIGQQLTLSGYTVDEKTGEITLQHQRVIQR